MIQLQPGARRIAALGRRYRDPGRPGRRLGVLHLGIQLAAPAGRIAAVAREQAAVELAAQRYLGRQLRGRTHAQGKTMRQHPVAHQQVQAIEPQLGRLARFVLPAQRHAVQGQLALARQPAQRRRFGEPVIGRRSQVDRLPGDPQAIGGIAPHQQIGAVDAQALQRGRQLEHAAPAQHRRHRGQAEHRVGLVIVDAHPGQVQARIQAAPVGAQAVATREPSAWLAYCSICGRH
ncbi:Uncharacterised protein [Bordetella pertussis]|nr:Uncharacterised protein [Bordetella pertussis]CRD94979.1 Uncharacterised protein [Bordetella pertussis]